MRIHTLSLALLFATACPGTPSSTTCDAGGDPTIEVGQEDGWNIPNGIVDFGIPPQGGSPYAPFQVRMQDVPTNESYVIRIQAFDDQDVMLEDRRYSERFVCANVGDNAGWRYAPDLHMRFFDNDPPELDGMDIRFTFSATSAGEILAEGEWSGTLDWTLGPL